MKRTLIARSSNLAVRQRTYRIDDGLEIDEIDHYMVHRSRVLYDDVILITHHQYRGRIFLWITGVLVALTAFGSWRTHVTEPFAGWMMFGTTTAPLLLLFLLRFILKVDEVNVYSRRSFARMRFVFRKNRARRLIEEIATAARNRQTTQPAALHE